MQKHRNDDRVRKLRTGGGWFFALRYRYIPLCLVGMIIAAGCQHSPPPKTAATNDPLFSSGNTPAPPRPLTSNAPGPQAGVAPIPGPVSSTSTAALASAKATSGSRDSANDLRINDTARSPISRGESGGNAWGGTVLQRPDAVPPGATVSGSPGANANLEQALAQLEARGATFIRLEYVRDQDQWQVSCSVPNAQNQSVSRTYSYKSRTGLDAVRAVLIQIDKDR